MCDIYILFVFASKISVQIIVNYIVREYRNNMKCMNYILFTEHFISFNHIFHFIFQKVGSILEPMEL